MNTNKFIISHLSIDFIIISKITVTIQEMSLQKTTFTWNGDAKNKENEIQSSAMEKEN